MTEKKSNPFSWRAFASVLAAISFIVMTFTGVILFVVPPGRIANWSGWTLLALTKDQWIALHTWSSLLFVAAAVLHVIFNFKPLIGYFKNKITRAFALRAEWIAALAVCLAVCILTLAEVAPFSSLLDWNESIKHGWDESPNRAPVPHAELLTLSQLADQVPDVTLEALLANIAVRGIHVKSPDTVLGDLAEANNMTPLQLYEAALGQTGPGRSRQGHGQGGRGPGGQGGRGQGGLDTDAEFHSGENRMQEGGFGRLTLQRYCEQINLETNIAIQGLKDAGFEATAQMAIRDIADSKGAHPSEILNLLQPPIP